ncbi:DUF202 domain-containing protein [bacterium]|nr:DUF202 domain-containing protein [candidate division CSSED10-310 bacterium]
MIFKKWRSDGEKNVRDERLGNPYTRFLCTELILRDQLAIDRTILANERTFLAYCRTSLALVVTGGGFIKFFNSVVYEVTGYTLIGFAIIVFVYGIIRSTKVSRRIKQAGIGMDKHHEAVCSEIHPSMGEENGGEP